jgi:hypothetical protein
VLLDQLGGAVLRNWVVLRGSALQFDQLAARGIALFDQVVGVHQANVVVVGVGSDRVEQCVGLVRRAGHRCRCYQSGRAASLSELRAALEVCGSLPQCFVHLFAVELGKLLAQLIWTPEAGFLKTIPPGRAEFLETIPPCAA